MTNKRPSLIIICQGMREETVRLQPWKYLYEIAFQLELLGWDTIIVTDGGGRDSQSSWIQNVQVISVGSVQNHIWRTNQTMERIIAQTKPDVVVWSLGLTSLAHQKKLPCGEAKIVGVFSSPIYSPQDFWRLGIIRLFKGRKLTTIHLIGMAIPKLFLRLLGKLFLPIDGTVFQTDTTRKTVENLKLINSPTTKISPGIDPIWIKNHHVEVDATKQELGYTSNDIIVVYFGSPAPLRGSVRLVQAFEKATKKSPSLRLLLLSRMRSGELREDAKRLKRAIERSRVKSKIQIVDGFLEPEKLVEYIKLADIVALPFELVPSDAPLSILEAAALEKPVVTTRTACLPELAKHGPHFLVPPVETASLADALLDAANYCQDAPRPDSFTKPRSWSEVGQDWLSYLEEL